MDMNERYKALYSELAQVCAQAGRNPDEVRIMAVSKTVGTDAVQKAIEAGFGCFGENRIEGLEEKQQMFADQQWHFIGNVQSRKISRLVAHADLIHSVYKESHLKIIDEQARKESKVQDILIEVNVSGESSKGGVSPVDVPAFIEATQGLDALCVKGFMTMAPQGDLDHARSCFEKLALLRDEMRIQFPSSSFTCSLDELSMGMSEDWREAVAAGATIVRIGRRIFSSEYTD